MIPAIKVKRSPSDGSHFAFVADVGDTEFLPHPGVWKRDNKDRAIDYVNRENPSHHLEPARPF